MKDIRNINRVFGFIPCIPVLCILVIGVVGILTFEEIPKYGINPDPNSLNIAWIQVAWSVPAFVCVFSIPTSIAISIHLKLNKIKFRLSDKISLVAMLGSVSIFILLKYGAPEFFLWIMD